MCSWYRIADWLSDRRCQERRRYGSCRCGRKHNPCLAAEKMAEAVNLLAEGQPADIEPTEVARFIQRKCCHFPGTCNHRGCIEAMKLVEWVREEQRELVCR